MTRISRWIAKISMDIERAHYSLLEGLRRIASDDAASPEPEGEGNENSLRDQWNCDGIARGRASDALGKQTWAGWARI